MTKKAKNTILKSATFWLIVCALAIELINILITWSLGTAQKDVCPKSYFPGGLSLFLGLASLVPIVAAMVIAKNKILVVAFMLFWVVLVVGIGYILQFAAVGGLDWCEFLGR